MLIFRCKALKNANQTEKNASIYSCMPGFSIPVQIIESRQGRTIEHEYEHNAAIHRVVQHFYNDSLEEFHRGKEGNPRRI
jgi:hypothetical protein